MNPFIDVRLAETLLTIILGVAFISALGCLLGRLLSRATSRHFVCAGALLGCGLFAISVVSFESLDLRHSVLPIRMVRMDATASSMVTTEMPGRELAIASELPMNQLPPSPTNFSPRNSSAVLTTATPIQKETRIQWATILCCVWAIGSAGMFLRLLVDLRRLQTILRRSKPTTSINTESILRTCCRSFGIAKPPRLLVSNASFVPFSVRFPESAIVLPKALLATLTAEELTQVLRHELAHIVRRDQQWLLLQRVTEITFWFVPTVFLNGRLLHDARERLCDNHVLQHHTGYAYGATLLKLAESLRNPVAHHAATQIACVRQSLLQHRIIALINTNHDGATHCKLRTRILGSTFLVITSLGLGLFSASGKSNALAQVTSDTNALDTNQESLAAEQRTNVFKGTVVDSSFNPVAGAQVILEVYAQTGWPQYTVSKTDEAGKFSISIPQIDFDRRHNLWAYQPGHSIRCVRPVKGQNQMILPPEEEILVALGKDVPADLTASPYHYEVPNGRYTSDEPSGLRAYIPPMLVQQFKWRPDEDGIISIKGFTKPLLGSVLFESTSLGQQTAPTDEIVKLRETGRVSGQITCHEGQLPENLVVYMTVDRPLPTARRSRSRLYSNSGEFRPGRATGRAEATVDAEGRFEVDAIASGKLRVELFWPTDSAYRPTLVTEPSELLVMPGEELSFEIEAIKAVTVRGQVIQDDTGDPVPDAKLALRPTSERGLSTSYAVTDENGWYQTKILPGEGTLQCYGLPKDVQKNYQYPQITKHNFEPTESGVLTLDEIRLVKPAVVSGTLQNALGEPVRDRVIAMTTRRYGHVVGIGKTNTEGRFEWNLNSYNQARLETFLSGKQPEGILSEFDPSPQFFLFPSSVTDVSSHDEITRAMSDWKSLPQAKVLSIDPLKLQLIDE